MDATPPPAPPPPPPAAPVVATAPAGEDNTIAIVAYLSIIGFIIALIMFGNKKSPLAAFHLRQTLGLFISWFVLCMPMAIPFLNLLYMILWIPIMITMFVFVIMGIIAAVNRQMKPLPLVGPLYQKWFANAFSA